MEAEDVKAERLRGEAALAARLKADPDLLKRLDAERMDAYQRQDKSWLYGKS